MNTLEVISKRKSIRSYTTEAVEKEKIIEVVDAGNKAAIAGKIGFTVITNKKILSVISEEAKNVMTGSGIEFLTAKAATPGYSPIYSAPVVILVTAELTGDPQTDGMSTANAACAAQNMLLAATELGLGSCYTVAPTLAFMVPQVKQLTVLTDNEAVLCMVILGYSNDNTPHPERKLQTNVHFYE